MFVAPLPVMALHLVVLFVVFHVSAVLFAEVTAVGMVFAIIPIVIIVMVVIVDADLDAALLRAGWCHEYGWCSDGGGQ